MLRNIRILLKITKSSYSTHIENVSTNNSTIERLPNLEKGTKLLKVAIIGVPNAGKSTFINNLMDRKVCATSSKVHTTRAKSMAILTESNSQIVFLDTPGLINLKERNRFNLERSFLKDSKTSLSEADVIGVIHDVSNPYTRDKLDIKAIRLLEQNDTKPSFLVLNKIDLLKSKRKLLDLIRLITDNHIDGKLAAGHKTLKKEDKDTKTWRHFQEIFMVSALTGNGLDEIRTYLIDNAKPADWLFPEDIWSDQSAEDLILQSVKAKLLDFIPQEIPYILQPEIEFFNVDSKGVITTVVLVNCPTERIVKLVAGVSDGKLRQITESLQHDLQDMFQNFVRIKLLLQTPPKKLET